MIGRMRPKEVWEKRHRQGHYNYLESDEFKFLYEFVSQRIVEARCSSILDVGCWSGMLCSALYAYGYMGKYLGFDISENAIQECREKFTYNDSARFMVHEFDKGYLDESFDSVYLGGILYYVSNREDFIRGIIARYNPKCIVIQDLVKTPVNINQFSRIFHIEENRFEMPLIVNNDPSLSMRKVFTLNLK